MAAPYTPTPEAFECVGFADFVVDIAGHRVTGPGGRDVPLRRAEFALLRAFLHAPGRVLSRDHLLDAVAGRESGAFDRSIDVLVSRLRRKIEPEPRSPRLIVTVPGLGYKFADQPFAVPARPETVIGAAELRPRSTERRQLTLMLCSVGGAGGVPTALDPEDLALLLPSYQELCEQVIRRLGGMVARSVNDGVLGYFGYPEAAEDDAEQAVRAGLAVLREVPSLDDRLRARVGIATGLAIVGGAGVLGEPIEVATRLLALAAPDTLVVSGSCQRLTGGLFEYEPLPAGGFTCSEHGFRVIGEAPVESRFAALRQCGLTPLFGRAEELTLLMRRWDQAGMGAGKVILISGEAGIGKSRMLREFRARVREDECFPLVFSCAPHREHSAYYPFAEYLERAAGFGRADSDASRREKLRTLLQQSDTAPDDVALLADLLSLKTMACVPDLTPRRRRELTMEALVGYLVAATRHRAALMVFEDAHWSDPTSREVLDQLIDRIANLPILLIVTYRPEFIAPWSTRAYATTITLNALDRVAAAEMVKQIAGRVMPEAVCSQIIDRADGVPLFIEEVTRAAVEVGGDAVSRSAFLPSASVPATLYASLTARLDRLGATARQVAQAGAAIGREFEHDLLAAIAGLPDDALGCALRWLEDAQLIHRRGAPPEATYSFRHVLLRDAAYSILLREPRRALHTRIAEAILRLRPEAAEREPQLLALHYTMAGLVEEAIGYGRLAGEQSVAQFANREAIGHFERALELVEALPPGANRDRLEADLRLAQVAPLMAIHGVGSQAVEACAARVKALADRLADWPGAFAARKVVWHTCLMRQPVPRALALAHDLLSLAERSGDPARIAIACRARGYSLYIAGEQGEADPVLARGIALADGLADTEFAVYGEEPRIICRINRGMVLCLLGYPEAALRIVHEGLARARARNNPHAVAWSLVSLADIHIFLRNTAGAEQAGAEAIDVARQHRLVQWLARAPQRRGWALCQLGDPHQGLALLEDGLRCQHATGHMLGTTRANCYLSEGCLLAGRPEAALGHIEAAHRHAETYGEHYMSAETHRLHAEVLHIQGIPAPEIEGHLREALNIGHSQQARLWELRAATGLARLWHTQGRDREAHGLLAPIYASFTEGLGLPDLIEARMLLSQTEDP